MVSHFTDPVSAINLLQLVYTVQIQTECIHVCVCVCVCVFVCVATYFSAPHRRQGEQQRASFRVVVWSLGVSSAPWQLTPHYGSKIWLFWRDGRGRKSKLCKCCPNSTLASNSPSSLSLSL